MLLKSGAKHLVQCSRSGGGDSQQTKKFDQLRSQYNAEIIVKKCDVSNSNQIRGLLADIRSDMPPLRGIIHGAMVLQDEYLHSQTDKSFRAVLGPKALGAWLIHDDTLKNKDLIDFFIMLSSLNVVVGTK
ncbi:MAG: putative polyketide synthase [Streblomastix strix]|uniref:Putative polyketide synthase n=1 Tax=Streblomastix strix TaxID=222440 RepID=A0A5J4U2H1_9EUKA|nr:MAG: putative polyketide synthase [Streblomastix strix]